MGGDSQCKDKVFEPALVMYPEGTPDRWQKVADHVNGRQICQLNQQVLWPPTMLPSTVRPHRPPMFKIRSLPRRPPTMFETIIPARGVQMKKQTPSSRRRVRIKRQKLEIANQELNAQFERLFSRVGSTPSHAIPTSGSTPSHATNKDDIEELSSKTSQIKITTLEPRIK